MGAGEGNVSEGQGGGGLLCEEGAALVPSPHAVLGIDTAGLTQLS